MKDSWRDFIIISKKGSVELSDSIPLRSQRRLCRDLWRVFFLEFLKEFYHNSHWMKVDIPEGLYWKAPNGFCRNFLKKFRSRWVPIAIPKGFYWNRNLKYFWRDFTKRKPKKIQFDLQMFFFSEISGNLMNFLKEFCHNSWRIKVDIPEGFFSLNSKWIL